MKTVLKRGLGVLLAMLMVIAILPQITINAKAASGVDDFVTRCYQVAFQRTPDQGGFEFWKAKITDGKLVGSTVVYEFIFSKEYEAQKRTDKEFVNDLYTMFMGRAADQQGYDYWCGQMEAGMSRKDVFAGFANSKEFYELCVGYGITSGFYTNDYDLGQVNNVNLFVERLYKTCLGRLGDQGGQKYWVEGMLKGELTGIGCAANYIKSQEYEALGLTDEQYVENLYIGFMGRTYDEGGKANWLGHLTNKTKTRDQVFEGFANSPEFQGICAGYGIECGSYTATDLAKRKIKESRSYYNGGLYNISYYDIYGNTIRIDHYSSSTGQITDSVKYEYDSNGNMTKILFNRIGSIDDFYCREEFIYDDNNLIKEIHYEDSKGKIGSIYEYEYDENNNEILKRFYYGNYTTLESSTEKEYDSNGNLLCVKNYYGTGELMSTVKFEYDSNNNQVSSKTYEGYKLTDSYTYEYDSKGNLIKESSVDRYGTSYKHTYKYDSYGNLLEEGYYIDELVDKYTVCTYNVNGKVVSRTVYGSNMKYLNTTEYEYDEEGNLKQERYSHEDGYSSSNTTEYIYY